MNSGHSEHPEGQHPARYWHRLEDGRIQCGLCPRACRLIAPIVSTPSPGASNDMSI
jgi:hypothetical protein